MKNNILFISVIGFVAVGAYLVFQNISIRPSSLEQTEIAGSPVAQAQTLDERRSQEKNGINISIEEIVQSDDATIIKLTMSNHQYDLGDERIFKGARLNETPMQSFEIIKNTMGGHHVEAKIVFAKMEQGSFRITPAPEMEFNFDHIW